MAKNLFQKLNTLVKASIHIPMLPGSNASSRQQTSKDQSKKIAALRRQQIKAEENERLLAAQQAELQEALLRWDEQVDRAVSEKREAEARYALEQMQLAKQRFAMLTSELEDYRQTIGVLARQISELEAWAASASTAAIEPKIPTEPPAIKISEQESGDRADPTSSLEDDLAARRSRLAKPEK